MGRKTSFVRFNDLPSDLSEDFQQQLAIVTELVDKQTRDSFQGESAGVAVRTAHGKSYGLLRASVTVKDHPARPYAQGLFAEPGTYDAAIRFSNGSGHLRHDTQLGSVCGLGLKIFGVAGTSTLPDDPDAGTFDYALINHPVFFCNTVHDYLTIEPLLQQLPDAFAADDTRRRWLNDFLTATGSNPPDRWRWNELLAFLGFLSIPRNNLLSYTYSTLGAVRHGDHVAKVRVRPTVTSQKSILHRMIDVASDDEAYRDALVAEVAERSHRLELQVQLSTDLTTMPVHDTTTEWPEVASPFTTVATIDIPRQDISDLRNALLADATTINPWRVREAHTPLGEIMKSRFAVYRRSSEIRHRINHEKRREPTTVDELFGMDLGAARQPAVQAPRADQK